MRPLLPALSGLAVLALMACAEPESAKPRLTLNSTSLLNLVVGDTSLPITVTKVTLDAQGRENKDGDYRYFTLVSADTSVAKVFAGRQLIAVGQGQTTVAADDDRSTLVSENTLTVQVGP